MSSQSRFSALVNVIVDSTSPVSERANTWLGPPLSSWVHHTPGLRRLAASPDASVIAGDPIVPASDTAAVPAHTASIRPALGDVVVGPAVVDVVEPWASAESPTRPSP